MKTDITSRIDYVRLGKGSSLERFERGVAGSAGPLL